MVQGKYYSIRDLANLSSQPGIAVTDVVKFLTAYGFVKRLGTAEPLYTRSSAVLSPSESMKLLKCIANK